MEAIDMTRKTSITAAVGAALLGLTLATQATTLRPTSAEVQDQIRIMETSITDSSYSLGPSSGGKSAIGGPVLEWRVGSLPRRR